MRAVHGRLNEVRAFALALFFAACMDGPPGGVDRSSAALELPFPLSKTQILPTQPIGTLTGTLSAGLDGQASYTMPLTVPRGRAGMEPSLALTYSSGAGNGPLGMGFAIKGLTSSITRCVHPHEQDGARRIRFDAQRRFCLDGEPLVLLAGKHGGVGSEYRTERESARRIVITEADVEPTAFEVWEPGGRVLEYANYVQGTHVHYAGFGEPEVPTSGLVRVAWSLTRVRDRQGNALELQYETHFTNDEPSAAVHRLTRIDYTSGPMLAPQRSVRVVYESRPDPRDTYVSGVRLRIDYRVKRLELHAPALDSAPELAWYYDFGYVMPDSPQATITGRSLLRSVTRCDGEGVCLPPTTFDWSRGSFDYETHLRGEPGFFSTQVADVNGDGLDDVVTHDADRRARVQFTPNGTWNGGGGPAAAHTTTRSTGAPLTIDVTGDGRAELFTSASDFTCWSDDDCDENLHCVHLGGPNRVGLCANSCWVPCPVVPGSGGTWVDPKPPRYACNPAPCVSVTGEDGLCDYFDEPDSINQPGATSECLSMDLVDGDGWRPHFYQAGSTDLVKGRRLGGHSFLRTELHGSLNFGDFDGDGAPDAILRSDQASWWVGRNSRDHADPFEAIWPYDFDPRAGMTPIMPLDSASAEHDYGAVTEIVDLDVDGRTDVLIPIYAAGTPKRYFQATLGATNADPAEVVPTNLRALSRGQLLLDVNGDGLLDALDLGSPHCTSPLSACAWVPPVLFDWDLLTVQINTGNGFGPRYEAASATEYAPFWPSEVYPPRGPTACAFDPEKPPPAQCRPDDVPWYAADLRYRVLDYNQDGLMDFIRLGPEPQVYVSDGSAFHPRPLPFGFVDTLVQSPAEPRKRTEFHVADFNGDHQPDFLVSSPHLPMKAYLSTGGQADLLVGVTNGVRATERIEYATLSDEAVYDDRFDFEDVSGGPARCGYPYACVDRAMTVVRRLSYQNPGHPERVLTYRYAGARRDTRTREHLGFARVYTEDSGSGEATEVWIDNTLEVEQEGARGAFHPLTFKAARVYSALRVGDRAHVTRTDYRYRGVDPSTSDEGGFEHPLVGHGLPRGYRAAPRDIIVRSYEDAWGDFAGKPELTLSQRYRAMRIRNVRAWRSDRREFDYRGVTCGASPCDISPGSAADRFSYPAAWTDTTYRGDLAGSLIDDLPDLDGLVSMLNVESFQRTAIERSFDEASWLIGLPVQVETERCATPQNYGHHLRCNPSSGEPDVVRRRVEFGYDTNLVTSIIREPHADATDDDGNPTGLTLTTTLAYDYGNVVSVTETSPHGETRVREVAFEDDEFVFPIAFTSHVGGLALRSWVGWHPALGVPMVTQAPNGAQSHARYDRLGRPRGTRAPGAASWVSVDYAGTGGPGMAIGVSGSSVPDSVTTLDALLRPIGQSHKAYLGGDVQVSMIYDALGRLASTTRPHFAGEDPTSVESTFDPLGRLTATRYREHPSASAETLATYDYRLEAATPFLRVPVATGVDALGNESETWQDLRGLLTRTRQAYTPESGAPRWIDTEFEHDLRGAARTVALESDELGTREVQQLSHVDQLGRPIRIVDPDRGLLELRYNSFDEVVWQRDALGNETHLLYDELGRLTERKDVDGTTSWIWDSATNGEGLLAASMSPDGVLIIYGYDTDGRRTYEVQHAGGEPALRFDYTYDSESRLRDIVYPENAVGTRFWVRYEYDDGYLARIVHDGKPLWTADERHADGRVRHETFGNEVTALREYDPRTRRLSALVIDSPSAGQLADVSAGYDALGRLEDRSDVVAGRTEHFDHDVLGRLRRWERTTFSGMTRLTYAYDDGGNLLEVRDVDTGSLEAELQYGGGGAGPHAVTEWNGEQLKYDELGRQVVGIGGREVKYTARDLPQRVVDGSGETLYEYDADGRRARAKPSAGAPYIRYVAGLYERRELAGGDAVHVCYVPGPEGIVAQITMKDLSSDWAPTYFHHDGLGSITVTTDEGGDLVARQWFSPFGRALHDDGSYADTLGTSVSRGFTGHEHDDAVGLINMQGRVYDPRLGRFLTTDPLIGDPAHSQAWNPYSYVMNAPLDLIDPSGFDWIPPPQGCGGPCPAPGRTFVYGERDTFSPATERAIAMQEAWIGQREAGAAAQSGTASTQPGAASTGSRPGSILSDLGSLAGAYGQGFLEGVGGLGMGALMFVVENPANGVVAPVYRAIQAYGNFQQGNIGTGILDVASMHPGVGAIRMGVEGAIGLYEAGEHAVDTLANGSAEDVARLGGQLTPMAVAAIALKRLTPRVRAAAPEAGGTLRPMARSLGAAGDDLLLKKAVNSNLAHAIGRGVERGVFSSAAEAGAALRRLTEEITRSGTFPDGTLVDTARAGRFLVPVGNNGMAVYQLARNGTAKLKTVLIGR